MSQNADFDPYYEWLAIPQDQRPPTHYQLLGVSQSETSGKVIETAALRQTSFLRMFQTGTQGEVCSRILAEIAAARAVLMDPARRREYDRKLGPAVSPKLKVEAPETPPAAKRATPLGKSDAGEKVIAPNDGSAYGVSGRARMSTARPAVENDEPVVTAIVRRPGASPLPRKAKQKTNPAVIAGAVLATVAIVLVGGMLMLRSLTPTPKPKSKESQPNEFATASPPHAESQNAPVPTTKTESTKLPPVNSHPADVLKKAEVKQPDNPLPPPKTDPPQKAEPKKMVEFTPLEINFKITPIPAPTNTGEPTYIRSRMFRRDNELLFIPFRPKTAIENELVIEESLQLLNDPSAIEFRNAALTHLAICEPNHRKHEVKAIVNKLLSNESHTKVIVAIFMKWDPINALDQLIANPDKATADQRKCAIEICGNNRDEDAIDSLFSFLVDDDLGNVVASAIAKYGPAVEERVLSEFQDKSTDMSVRRRLCVILGTIGSLETADILLSFHHAFPPEDADEDYHKLRHECWMSANRIDERERKLNPTAFRKHELDRVDRQKAEREQERRRREKESRVRPPTKRK